MNGIIKKIFSESLLIALLGFVIVTWNKLKLCQEYFGFGFDQQAFLFWDYAHSLNLILFRDFFYPYGLLFFLKIENHVWYFVSVLLSGILIGSIFMLLKTTFKDRLYTYTFFIAFCIFSNLFLSLDAFLRYSPLILICFLLSFFIQKKKLFSKTSGFSIGFTLGLLFSFINDLFFYSFAAVAVISLLHWLFENRKLDKKILKFSFFLLMGVLIGSIPLLVYLVKNDSIPAFIDNYNLLRDVSLFAKVPFPPTLKSFENLFIIGVILLSLFSLIPGFSVKKERNFYFYLKLSLVIGLLLLEQKNIVRSFYSQLSFIGFLLFLLLLGSLKDIFEKLKVNKRIIYLFILNLIALVFFLVYFDRGMFLASPDSKVKNFANGCLNNKMAQLDKKELEKYTNVRNFIQKEKNVKIFSFPGDPVYYILFKQYPPPYPSVYEATPFFAQNKMIKYIEDNNVQYVIYNTKSSAIQDGVPDKIRSRLLYEFITKNYYPVKKIENFLILKRKMHAIPIFSGQ